MMRIRQKRVATDPWGVEQYHWNTGAKKAKKKKKKNNNKKNKQTKQLNPGAGESWCS